MLLLPEGSLAAIARMVRLRFHYRSGSPKPEIDSRKKEYPN